MYDLSIIFVNYFTCELMKTCISSIHEHLNLKLNYEIIVVDNSNDIEEFNRIKSFESTNIHVINAQGNLGFGKANNLGVEKSQSEIILFLNTDTILIDDSLIKLVEYLRENEHVGAVGPNILDSNRNPTHSFYLNEFNIKNEKKKNSLVNLTKQFISNRRMDFNYSTTPLVINGYICGACLMVKKRVFEQAGQFDKNIFMYAEDALLCHNIIFDCKMDVVNIPDCRIIHLEGGNDERLSINRATNIINGTFYYFKCLFSYKKAMKYLHYLKRNCRFKLLLSYLFFDKARVERYRVFIEAVDKKIIFEGGQK